MRRVLSVSFPRSGHHFLVSLLARYFGCRWSYCEQYNTRRLGESDWDRPRCKWPCESGAALSKTHDFDLDASRVAEAPYLVQWREPMAALASWYAWDARHANREQTRPDFLDWLDRPYGGRHERDGRLSPLAFWTAWTERWVVGMRGRRMPTDRLLILRYSTLVDDPAGALLRAVRLFEVVPEERIARAVAWAAARPRSERFRSAPFWSPEAEAAIRTRTDATAQKAQDGSEGLRRPESRPRPSWALSGALRSSQAPSDGPDSRRTTQDPREFNQ